MIVLLQNSAYTRLSASPRQFFNENLNRAICCATHTKSENEGTRCVTRTPKTMSFWRLRNLTEATWERKAESLSTTGAEPKRSKS